ncbi:MAG: hypothetical protein KAR47_03330 [Planctomycetes bacterium]|nr:hypothetical protein [Planctomycetota bacterium]
MMLAFSTDSDILRNEAVFFGDLHFPWQVLCEGSGGVLSGSSFSVSGEDFVSAGVGAGGVIYLESVEGSIEGAYEIVSVDSATSLTVSVLRSDGADSPVGIGSGSDVVYRVCTFGPQANEVGYELTQYFGIAPGNPNSVFDVEDIVDASVLRQASVYAVVSRVYVTLAGRAGGDEGFWKKSVYYQRLFEKARERCRLSVDAGGDGISDRTNLGGSVRLVRD